MTDQITLYHYWRSSCSWRLRWALNLKNVPHTLVAVNLLKSEQKAPAYLAINPSGYVPSLDINGEIFGESLAVIEMLEERYPLPNPLLPRDPAARARVRHIAHAIATGIQPMQNLVVTNAVSGGDKGKADQWSKMWNERGLHTVEALLQQHGTGTFACGSTVTMADLCLIPQVYSAKRYSVDMNAYPLCERIYQTCMNTPECDKARPELQPDAPKP